MLVCHLWQTDMALLLVGRLKIPPARIYCWMNPIPIPSNPRSETITETLKRHELPPPVVPRNLFKQGTTWVSSTTPKLRPCCQPTFRFLEEFPETAKTWCDGSGWDGFGPLLLSELLLRATNGPGCCWLSTGMNKRLLPCVFEGVEQAFDDLEFDSCHFKWDSEIPRWSWSNWWKVGQVDVCF